MGRFMETCVLVLLCDADDHGYSLAEQLAGFGIGDVNASTLYRVMRKMEDHGWVRSEWEDGGKGPQRRVYTITDSGRAALGEEIAAFEARRDSIDMLIKRYRQIPQ
jgi:DNA-binding PadR family transcriptional regulator